VSSRVSRRAAKVDANQPGIVDALREIPGMSVEVDHDDILVGYKGRTYWYEIKAECHRNKMTKACNYGALKDKQKDLLRDWKGHYKIVFTVDEILKDIGITQEDLRRMELLKPWGYVDGEIPDKIEE